jgi:hypothetical protein
MASFTLVNKTQQPLLFGVNTNSVGSGTPVWSGVVNVGVSSGVTVSGTASVYSMQYSANSGQGFLAAQIIPNILDNSVVTVALVVGEQAGPS